MAIETIYNKDRTVSYRARVKDPSGKWYPAASFASKLDAKADELRLKRLKASGSGLISEDARRTTELEYWEVWSRANRGKVSDGWKISQDQMHRDFIEPVLGRLTLAEIGFPQVGLVLSRMEEKGKSAQLRLHVYSLMRRMFGDAVEYYRMLPENPVSAKHHRPEVIGTERDFLRPDQAWTLLNAVQGHSYLGIGIYLQLLAGLRCEAMIALKWDSVDFETDQLLIRRAWKQKTGELEDYPKGKTWEYLPMTPPLRAYLLQIFEQRKPGMADFVAQGPNGGRLSYETYCRALPKLCVSLGLPRITAHGLRHSCSELLVQVGASQVDVGRFLHHKDPSTTKRYMHRTDDRLRVLANRVGPGLRVIEGGEKFPSEFPSVEKTSVCVSPKGGSNAG